MEKDMAKKYYWLKLKDNFFNQKEVKKLRRIAGGDTYTIIYLKLQLLSIKKEGIIEFEGTEKDLAEQLSYEIDEDIDNIQITLSFLIANNLIEEISENNFLLTKVPDCIGKEGASAERVRRHRERKALEEKERKALEKQKTLQCNADVTASNMLVTKSNTEIEKEKEKNIEIEKEKNNNKKEKRNTEIDDLIESYTDNKELIDTLYEFIKFRKGIKKPMSTHAVKLMLSKLNKFSNNDSIKIEILNQSILNGWTGIFELKNGYNRNTTNNNNCNSTETKGKIKFGVKSDYIVY